MYVLKKNHLERSYISDFVRRMCTYTYCLRRAFRSVDATDRTSYYYMNPWIIMTSTNVSQEGISSLVDPQPPAVAGARGGGTTSTEEAELIWEPDGLDGDVLLLERKGNEFHLATILRKYTSAKVEFIAYGERKLRRAVVKVDKDQLWNALGLLRSLQYDVACYNRVVEDYHRNQQEVQTIASTLLDPSEAKYLSFRLTRQAAAFGVRMTPQLGTKYKIVVAGLDSLVQFIQDHNKERIEAAQANIEAGLIDFESLQEFFQPGQVFVDHGVGTGVMVETLMRARACYYAKSKSLFGTSTTFHVAMEVVVSTGDAKYAVVEAQFIQSSFNGTRSTQHCIDMFTSPTSLQIERLRTRGLAYQAICGEDARTGTGIMVEYEAGTFLPTNKGSLKASSSSRTGSYGQASRSAGRMMVDTLAAWSRGVNCANNNGVAADAVVACLKTYTQKRRQEQHQQRVSTSDEYTTGGQVTSDADMHNDMLILSGPLPECLVAMTWPLVPGFSLQARTWGVAMVHGTSNVQFNEQAFQSLVMSESRKKLIKALVISHEAKRSADLIAGKGEGSIFLLHGPPGVGQ